jgi:short-subunit dehydrogenase
MSLPENPHFAITGASSGLGEALAEHIATYRHPLTLIGRDAARLEAISLKCTALGSPVESILCDVRNAAELGSALKAIDAKLPIDVVIANAGLGGAEVMTQAGGEPLELATEVIDVNVMGVINTVFALQQRFVSRKRGQFVLISSMAAYEGLAEAPAYAGSKAFVRVYGHGLRRHLAQHGIGVNIVVPGFVATPMSRSLNFKLPFLVDAPPAARAILAGIKAGNPEIRFPWQLSLGARLSALLPVPVVDWILKHERRKRRFHP